METLNDIRHEAKQAISSGNLSYSIELYEKIFNQTKSKPLAEDVIHYGAILRKSKQLKKASDHYSHYLNQLRFNIQFIQNACNCWIELKDFDKCRTTLLEALENNKNDARVLLTLGYTELSAGELQKAKKIFENILEIDSNNFDAWFNLAASNAKAGYLEEALSSFRQANKLQSENVQLKANIITILVDLQKIEEAKSEIEILSPAMRSSLEIRATEAAILMTEEKFADASKILEDLTQKQPHIAKHWLNWSTSLKAMKYTVAPKEILKIAIQWHPKNIDLQHSFAQSIAEMGELESYKRIQSCWKQDMTQLSEEHIFSKLFQEISCRNMEHKTIRKLARYWEQKQLTPETSNLWADRIRKNLKDRPIKIGYLSADWRNHPVGRFMLPILKNHNPQNFEVWCIDSTPTHDWITNQLKQNSDHWINIKHLNGLEAARQISDMQLDVLVELGGFTGGSRLDCLVHQPCAIQLSYLGYPGPTYLNCITGWIGDKELFSTLSKEEQAAHPLEYIDGGYMAFDPGSKIPSINCHTSENFRFGCFNHARKLTNPTIELFCRILEECPQSELYLKSISFHEKEEQNRICKKFVKQGIDPKRLIILDWSKGGMNHLACYNLIDTALDPFPYGGATTTAESLWMGVPVITQRHSGMAGCLSASILTYGGQEQWITNTKEEYLQISKTLFAKGTRSKEDRVQLRLEMQTSPIGNGSRLSKGLESLYCKLMNHTVWPSC